MKRAGRSMYRKIYGLPLLGVFILMLLGSHFHSFVILCVLLFLGWAIAGRLIAYWLVPLFVTTFKCPGCGEEMNTIGVWNCACGFNDHRERNILTKRCPKCGKGASHLDCPRCNCTILLW